MLQNENATSEENLKMAKQRDKQFQMDAIKYREEHPELSTEQCSKKLGKGRSTICRWIQEF